MAVIVHADWNRFVPEIRDALLDRRLAVFAGAGISMGGRANLPGWTPLIKALLREIAGTDGLEAYEYVTNDQHAYMQLLFNEVILQLMKEILGLDATRAALICCLDAPVCNPSHRFLAWSARRFGCELLTTNFDVLLERAGAPPERVLKLHGTLDDLEGARFTVDNVFQPLAKNLDRDTKARIAGKTLLVIGYRGEDEFDVVPTLLQGSRPPARVLWIVHDRRTADALDRLPSPRMTDGIRARLNNRVRRGTAAAIAANTPALLEAVYQSVIARKPEAVDPELDDWTPGATALADDWWDAPIREWGEALRHDRGEAVRYLWARVLDHLRVYQVSEISGKTRNFVQEAFERFRGASPTSAYRMADAAVRAAVMRRTLGAPDLAAFAEVDRTILDGIARTPDDGQRQEWQRLRGYELHQHAVAIQSDGLRQKELGRLRAALDKLREAQDYRGSLHDDEVAFSVFQQYILATKVEQLFPGNLNTFAPLEWRNTLADDLVRYARRFQASNRPSASGTTWHNAGYVHQQGALELETSNDLRAAENEFGRALVCYETGKKIRARLRDPRMIAQSDVRLAECELGLVRLEIKQGLHARGAVTRSIRRLQKASRYWVGVHALYAGLPQEPMRYDDLNGIGEGVIQLLAALQPAD